MDFMRNGSNEQKHELLFNIGESMLKYTNFKNKKYLSTHGKGVPWLHVRICDSPKYYSFEKYKSL
jgi:hypothetical protein